MIDLEWLRRLIDLVDESDIDSLEVRRLATHVKISKSPAVSVVSGGHAPPPQAGAATGVERSARASEVEAPRETGAEDEGVEPSSDLHEVKSPMVGTFYRAPAPDAPAYVEVGDPVKKGQTLCILEAMKLMNELESEVSGTIREIGAQNAEPVEFGQLLFRIEVDGGS